MHYLSPLQGYLWDTGLLLVILTVYFQLKAQLTIRKFLLYCLPLALFLALFSYYLSDWIYSILILIQVLVNLKRKIPIFSLNTIYLLAVTIVMFILGNAITLVTAEIRFWTTGGTSELTPTNFGIALDVSLIMLMLSLLYSINRYHVKLSTLANMLADENVLKPVILFLTLLLAMEEVVSVVSVQLRIAGTFLAVIIICFVIFTILTIVLMYYFIISYRRSLRAKQEAIEKQQQETYLNQIEANYNELRHFRHDYQNILISLQGYLLADDVDKSKKYIQETLNETTSAIDLEHKAFMNLPKLQVPGIRQLLFEKIKQILVLKIAVSLEIDQAIVTLPGSQINLARIVGILMDNAIEATKLAANPEIHIAIIKYSEDAYEFDVENTLIDPVIDITELFQEGYSTKHDHSGLGLANVNKLVQDSETYSLEVTKHTDTIRFSLMMQK